MRKPKTTCCFTGHRPQNLHFGFDEDHPDCIRIKKTLEKLIVELIKYENTTEFISGMALGVDMWGIEIVLDLKKKLKYRFGKKKLTAHAAIPCRGQDRLWDKPYQDRYKQILISCDSISLLQHEYSHDCMMKRNKYMVDNSDYVIAVWDGKKGGTEKTVKYAQEQEKTVYIINPYDGSVTTTGDS